MGQYHKIVNLDRREYLHAHRFEEGLKLMEFEHSSGSILTGLAVLLAGSNGRGWGDFRPGDVGAELVGSWRGDRVVAHDVDYEEIGDVHGVDELVYPDTDDPTWRDISGEVVAMLKAAGEWRLCR